MIRPGHIITNYDLKVTSLNNVIEQWTKDDFTSVIDCQLMDVFPELEGMESLLQQIIAGEVEPLTLTKVRRQSDRGKTLYLDLYLEPLPMSDNHLSVQIIDVSEQARLAQELTQERNELRLNVEQRKRVEAALRAANASKDKFFSILAHDLRDPLHGFMAYTELLRTEPNSLDPSELEQTFTMINESARNLYKLLENLLTWSRIQTGILKCTPRMLDLRELADQHVSLFKQRAEQKQLRLSHEVAENSLVQADYDMISTVFRNLISNALKFTAADGQIIIKAASAIEAPFYQISVHDEGVGLSPQAQAKIFRIDEKHVSTGTSGELGTGLGLLLCKELVEENGGKIWIDSQVGAGSTFHFTLPKANQAEVEAMMADLARRIG